MVDGVLDSEIAELKKVHIILNCDDQLILTCSLFGKDSEDMIRIDVSTRRILVDNTVLKKQIYRGAFSATDDTSIAFVESLLANIDHLY